MQVRPVNHCMYVLILRYHSGLPSAADTPMPTKPLLELGRIAALHSGMHWFNGFLRVWRRWPNGCFCKGAEQVSAPLRVVISR